MISFRNTQGEEEEEAEEAEEVCSHFQLLYKQWQHMDISVFAENTAGIYALSPVLWSGSWDRLTFAL